MLSDLKNIVMTLDLDQLRELQTVVRERFNSLQRVTARSFTLGDRVEFTARGQQQRGYVIKINQKTVSVQVDNGARWKVAASLLNGETV